MPPRRSIHQQSQSHLFILPPELRDLIYRLVLTKATPVSPQRKSHRTEERAALPLLQTCQRVHQEAIKIYFSTNTFLFFDDGELDEVELPLFFRSLSAEHLRLCTAVSLESSLGPQVNRPRCFRAYCVGSIEMNLTSMTVTTTGRTNCCDKVAEVLTRARAKVQALLTARAAGANALGTMGPAERAGLGSEVGLEFCATFEHLHPDYGD